MTVAAVAAAIAAAALLPGEPLGIGVPLTAVLVALAVARAAGPSSERLTFGLAALALTAFAALRDASWVVGIDLGAAWLLGCVAAAGTKPMAVAAPLLRLRDLPALSRPEPARLAPALRGALLAALLAVPFAALFWTADAAFAEVAGRAPLPSGDSLPGRVLAFAIVLLAALGLALASRRPPAASSPRATWRLSPWEWAVPLAVLDALFLAFVVVQVTVLFGGHDHVLRTAGLTYAEYARQGFWQLLAAAALTLAVIGMAALLADTSGRAQRVMLRILLGLLCALTVVVLISALRRLRLYEDAFGLTRPRLLAEAFALWLGAAIAVVVPAAAIRRVRPLLPGFVVAGTAAALIAFSFLNPDGLVAERNIERWRATGMLDVAYLRTLSADAAPALSELPRSLRVRALAPLARRLAADEPWSSTNLARGRARRLLETTAQP